MNRKNIYKFIATAIALLLVVGLTPTQSSSSARVYLNPHEIYSKALSDPNFVVTGVYGTPIGGSDRAGWGSANNGYEDPNFDPFQNFHDGNAYVAEMLRGKETVASIDAVIGYGITDSGNMRIVGKSVDFLQEVYNMGNIGSANLRPGGQTTMEELKNSVTRLWSGQATYADGSFVISSEFVCQTGLPLSLDLEEMVRAWDSGLPASELAQVYNAYAAIMKGCGYDKPVALMYDRGQGVGEYDMVDNASAFMKTLDPDLTLIIIFSGFVGNGDVEFKIEATENIIESYTGEGSRGGCMSFSGWSNNVDRFDTHTEAVYFNQDVCALAMLQ